MCTMTMYIHLLQLVTSHILSTDSSHSVLVWGAVAYGNRFDICWKFDASHFGKPGSIWDSSEICEEELLVGIEVDASLGLLL